MNRGLQTFVKRLRDQTPEQRVETFRKVRGIGEKGLERLDTQLALLQDSQIEQGFVDRGPEFLKLIPIVVQEQIVALAKGETDEPVTSDTKRLIRTPGSLHGKSGLRVVKLTRDELTDFDPLRDAVAFGDEPVDVAMTRSMTVSLKGETLKLEPGRARVPEYAAVFAALLGAAVPQG